MTIPLFDAHCDTVSVLQRSNESLMKNKGHLDILRMESYAPAAQIFALFPFWDDFGTPEEKFKIQYDFFLQQMNACRGKAFFCRKRGDAVKAGGRIRAYLSVEGAELLGCSLAGLRIAAELGVRLINITWNYDNTLCGAAMSGSRKGLTAEGMEFCKEMERLDVIPDVSHLSEEGFWDLCEVYKGVVVASHSCAAALCNHPRNLTDDQFETICKRNGVVGINLYTEFLGGDGNVEQILRHIEHFVTVGGWDNICLGCDFDGCDSLPEGIGGVQDMYKIYHALIKRGHDKRNVEKLFYKNLERVVELK